MEFVNGLDIITDMKECSRNCIFCGHNCDNCDLQHSVSDKIEALQMAEFALKKINRCGE